MFTGIIKETAEVRSVRKKAGSLFLEIEKPKGWRLRPGDSVAVQGVCLTMRKARIANGRLRMIFELMPETLSKTVFGVRVLKCVNLELPMRLSDKVHGHFVTGHVDSVGKVSSVVSRGASKVFEISYPKKFSNLLAEKGSIAVDGVSLTIARRSVSKFAVSLVSYTLGSTTLGEARKGDLVNLEFDILAKYGSKSPQGRI